MNKNTTTSFQLPASLLSEAQARARELGLSWAGYLRLLVRADLGKEISINQPRSRSAEGENKEI